MKWTPERLLQFMNMFGLSALNISQQTGISKGTLYSLNYGDIEFDKYESRLTAYYESKREGKIREHQKMIDYYNSLTP